MRSIAKGLLFFLALSLLTLSGCGDAPATTRAFSTPTGTGYLRKSDTLWILNLQGSYYDMGREYGALLGNELRTAFAQMDAAIGSSRPEIHQLILALEDPSLMDPRERALLTGMHDETGLSFDDHEFLNVSLFFMYANVGCSAFGATDTRTVSGTTIAGRNFDNPRGAFSTILRGKSLLVIYNPQDQFTGTPPHRDNSVAAMTQIGWLYGLTNLNSKGIYLEYNNGTNSIQIDPTFSTIVTIADGLHQNLFAAFDSDTLEDIDTRLAGKAAVATMSQVADATRVWHWERSPYESARKIPAGSATGRFYYANPADTSIFTNHFFFADWLHQVHNDPASTDPLYRAFSLQYDSGSKTVARLRNLQDLAVATPQVDVAAMKEIMTKPLQTDGGGGPFIGWELGNPDVTHFTSVTDVANLVMHIYPNIDAMLYVDSWTAKWAAVDLKREFR